ncbi:hypothetical protein ACQKH3_27030, partial [Streptomyces niveus]|uniref:hypothetical protein n=1 Tax=Streptomyces niveus TaxID=193462 RepID=UPI003CFD1892
RRTAWKARPALAGVRLSAYAGVYAYGGLYAHADLYAYGGLYPYASRAPYGPTGRRPNRRESPS